MKLSVVCFFTTYYKSFRNERIFVRKINHQPYHAVWMVWAIQMDVGAIYAIEHIT